MGLMRRLIDAEGPKRRPTNAIAPMERPPPPAPAPATAPATFSGFLPSDDLLECLVQVSEEVSSMGKTPLLHARNVSSTVRRVRLLASLFEELRGWNGPLRPSSLLSLTELLSTIRRAKALVEECAAGSALWGLLQAEADAGRFHAVAREMGRALDILPLAYLAVHADVREQVELLHRQAKRAEVFVDPRERRLREELLQVLAGAPRGHVDGHSGGESCSGGGLGHGRVGEIAWEVGLRSSSDCDEEVARLEAEVSKQAGTGGLAAVSDIKTLISLVLHWKSMVPISNSTPSSSSSFPSSSSSSSSSSFSSSPLEKIPYSPTLTSFPSPLRPPMPSSHYSSSPSAPSSSSSSSVVDVEVPDEFRCPITLELMRNPVIVASGHTYERSSIARWINSGRHTCPKSGQRLLHMALIPNYALKSLIHHWCCQENTTPLPSSSSSSSSSPSSREGAVDHISAMKAAVEAVRMTAEFLVGKLAVGSPARQLQAAYELRLLAKTGMDNRRLIAEAGAVPFLVNLLASGDPPTQENAVTALLNLSILDHNKLLIAGAPGAVDGVVGILCSGGASMEARENAAAALFSLSVVDDCKVAIGSRPGAVEGLLRLLREGTPAGKRDAATALHSLALFRGNRGRVVAAGAVPLLVELLGDASAGVTDDALELLALLCGSGEGAGELAGERAAVPLLVELLRWGTAKGKENALAALLGMCRRSGGGEEVGRRLWRNPHSVPALHGLAAEGSPRAKKKADALLRLLSLYCSQPHHPAG